MELQAKTGEWMKEFAPFSSKRRCDGFFVPSTDVIQNTITRSWTISNPSSPRWCTPRNSTEMRAYSSLPRHEDENTTYKVDKAGRRTWAARSDPDQSCLLKIKSKSLNASQESGDDDVDRLKPKHKATIIRQASVEEINEGKIEFLIPKIEILKRDDSIESCGNEESKVETKQYVITSPNSSKLRERFSKSKILKTGSLAVDSSSRSLDSGLGNSKSVEDETLLKPDDKNNFLDPINILSRPRSPRSRERSVSSDSSDKNLSDYEKPNIKIRRRHEYSENRDSSSSFEGNTLEPVISDRVRRLHEIALKRLEEEKKKSEVKVKHVDFDVEYDSEENERRQERSRKFKSLERRDTKKKSDAVEVKQKVKLKKQDNVEEKKIKKKIFEEEIKKLTNKRLSRKDKKARDDVDGDETDTEAKSTTDEKEVEETGADVQQMDRKDLDEFLNNERFHSSCLVVKNEERKKKTRSELDMNPYLEVVGKILPISDDYRLVFISSDSSTKENRSVSSEQDIVSSDSSESETDSSKKLISDCDWDYFESSLVRPVLKDWSWNRTNQVERSSPVFSTSDDYFDSPNLTRKRLARLGNSPASSEIDIISPLLNRKSVKETSSEISSEQEIEVSLKTPPPIRKKESTESLKIPFVNSELEAKTEEDKKNKRKKGKRSLKGKITKDAEEIESKEEGNVEEVEVLETNLETSTVTPVLDKTVEETNASEQLTVEQSSNRLVGVESAVKNKKIKNKRRKNRVKSHSLNGENKTIVTKEAEVQVVIPDGKKSNLEPGNFGYQPQQQQQITRNVAEAFTCNCPLFYPSNVQNFVPVPVPVPIPVPFPVPATFWTQNYPNFFFPNFDLFNFYAQNFVAANDNVDNPLLRSFNVPLLAFTNWCSNNVNTTETDNVLQITGGVDKQDASVDPESSKIEMNKNGSDEKPYKDELVECQIKNDDLLLLSIDKKSVCSSSSDQSDVDKYESECYYLNMEEKAGDGDSDIADVSSGEVDLKKEDEEATSNADSTSEDEGNPDCHFNKVFVVNEESKTIETSIDDDTGDVVLLKHVQNEKIDEELSGTESMDLHVDDSLVLVEDLAECSASVQVFNKPGDALSVDDEVNSDNVTSESVSVSSLTKPDFVSISDNLTSLSDILTNPCETSEGSNVNGDQSTKSFLDTIESRIRHFSKLSSEDRDNKYTSLVLITQDDKRESVNVVTSDTTVLSDKLEQLNNDITVRHTNWNSKKTSLEEYFTMTLENARLQTLPKKPKTTKMTPVKEEVNEKDEDDDEVRVVTGDQTLSAVICLEEGLADDDSWVENVDLEKERENDFIVSDVSSGDECYVDREEELRGYHRAAIDFTLHTIVEESCEESEPENREVKVRKMRPTSATELEKYFFFDIGGGGGGNKVSLPARDIDTFSECSSSVSSDGNVVEETECSREVNEMAELATSRLEKYFLTGFLGFNNDGRGRESDGSVGSDSEGRPSPEQRRKRLFRARGTSRLHSNSLDNLLQSENEQQSIEVILDSEHSSTETDETEPVDKSENCDTVKRKKKRKISGGSSGAPLVVQDGGEKKVVGLVEECKDRESLTKEHRRKEDELTKKKTDESCEEEQMTAAPQQLECLLPDVVMSRDKQQSRDSGFIGSCDDLLKEQKSDSEGQKSVEIKQETKIYCQSTPPATGLTRKDSFNNWSSDEETNMMMSKMRQFFKSMVSGGGGAHVPRTNKLEETGPTAEKLKPPQLVYFESELTRLMKTVPGIRDDQVREIVEYLSSEDTWSDSYDSSDYTSSDLEGNVAAYYQRNQLRQEISKSCQQIINKFENANEEDAPRAPPRKNSSPLNKETAFVYQKLVASFNKMTNEESTQPYSSPPLIAKVMHHIGSRLVALMHEVSSNSSGEGSINSQKVRYHKRIGQKLSNVSSTTEEEFGLTDTESEKIEEQNQYFQLLHQLPRSKSHDLLLEEAKGKSLRSSSSGVSDIVEEREASDYERFSWRGSFESALMASDSRSKLTLLSNDNNSNTSLAAKRRSAGDLLFSQKSLSREQLDRVRSCGSIGGVALEDKTIWTRERSGRRRCSVPDAASPGSGASADGDEDSSDSELAEKSVTLPRSLITSTATTNSLPRLPTATNTNGVQTPSSLMKAQSVQHSLPNVKSARYRPPGFNRNTVTTPKRAASAPGLHVPQPSHIRRERRRNQNTAQNVNQPTSLSLDELNTYEVPVPGGGGSSSSGSAVSGAGGLVSDVRTIFSGSKSTTPSPIVGGAKSKLKKGPSSVGTPDWSTLHGDDDLEHLVALQKRQNTSSSLGARSDSMASVYSGAGENRYGTVTVRGEVEFGVQYNYKAGTLEIHVKQCRDLAAVDVKRNRSDPYVKVYLLPDKSKGGKRKTKVKKHTLNPVFDEVLKFHTALNGLGTRTLWLAVWHCDMFGRNDFLGEVLLPFENKVFDDPIPQFYTLQERTEPMEEMLSFKGDIIIGLKFLPPDVHSLQKKGKRSKGTLHVKVKEAKCLTAVKTSGTSDPFCKSYLLPDKGRSSKQKTPVQRRTCNPTWNHTFIYDDVSLQELSERCLELTVWDHDRLGSNEFLGGLRFSLGTGKHYGKTVDWMDSAGRELTLWQSMLEKPNLWVEGCLSLRPSLLSSSNGNGS